MLHEIGALKIALNISDAQLLLLAREASQDAALRSVDLLTQTGNRELLGQLRVMRARQIAQARPLLLAS